MSTIEAKLVSGYQVRTTAGAHEWIADEPVSAGGTDLGPNPYELLLGALASCTIMTIQMYCERKGWPLTDVSASFTHDRIHARDCEACDDDAGGYVDRITSKIRIEGDFDDAQRERLQQVAVRCPVHKTLGRGVTFDDHVSIS